MQTSQEFTQPIEESTPAHALTYDDILQWDGLHPDLRVHVERLAAGMQSLEASAKDDMVDFASTSGAQRFDAAENVRDTSEISPAHHQAHIDLAKPVVPDIDQRPAPEQNLIGAVLELGKEALDSPATELGATEVLSPQNATDRLAIVMDGLEAQGELTTDKAGLIAEITSLLHLVSQNADPRASRAMRNNDHFQKLGVTSTHAIRHSLERRLHGKVIDYLDSIGLRTDDAERAQIQQHFETVDRQKKQAVMDSYSQGGLLTLSSALKRGVLSETSSDFGSLEEIPALAADDMNIIRGYTVSAEDVDDKLFYGRNSFFGVVMERGGESIDRATDLPKIEVENRMRNSMLFVVEASAVEISSRGDNVHKEDIVAADIPLEAIGYVIVDKSNYDAAKESFGHLPIQIIGVETVQTELAGHYDGPYLAPDYKGAVGQITATEGSIWCHIARLPTDTYPKHASL